MTTVGRGDRETARERARQSRVRRARDETESRQQEAVQTATALKQETAVPVERQAQFKPVAVRLPVLTDVVIDLALDKTVGRLIGNPRLRESRNDRRARRHPGCGGDLRVRQNCRGQRAAGGRFPRREGRGGAPNGKPDGRDSGQRERHGNEPANVRNLVVHVDSRTSGNLKNSQGRSHAHRCGGNTRRQNSIEYRRPYCLGGPRNSLFPCCPVT